MPRISARSRRFCWLMKAVRLSPLRMSRSCSTVTPPENVSCIDCCSKRSVRGLDRHRTCARRRFQLDCAGRDRQLHVFLQLESFRFLFDDGAGRCAGNVFTLESDRRVGLGHAAVLIERQRLGFDFQFVFRFDLDVADERNERLSQAGRSRARRRSDRAVSPSGG